MNSSKPFTLSDRSDAVLLDPAIAPPVVQQAYILSYIGYAMLTVIVYNSATTFDKEVHYFWRKPFSIVAYLFFFNRFAGLLGAITYIITSSLQSTAATCEFSQWVTQLCTVGNVLAIDYVLLLRVLALYSQNKKLSMVMRLMFALESSAFLGLVIYTSVFVEYSLGESSPSLILCGTNNELPQLIGSLTWAVPLAYGTILLCLALYKATELWKETHGIKGVGLARVLIQDQVFYYVVVIFCAVSNIIGTAIVEGTIFSNILKSAGDPALLCVLGNHLLINLKEAAERGQNGGTSYGLEAISAIDFGLAPDQNSKPSEYEAELSDIAHAEQLPTPAEA